MGLDVAKQLGAGAAIAESTRGKEKLDGLMADLFRGKLNMDRLFAWKNEPARENSLLKDMLVKLKQFLIHDVDPEEIERTSEIPERVVKWLCDNGYFGLKVPKEFGGCEFLQSEYQQILKLVASRCGALVALLSASNTIGIGWPIVAYGSPEQKQKWLPIAARNPSAFAFTEEKAGSDPAAMETVAVRVKVNGVTTGYRLCGRKWWTTNGPKDDKSYLSPVICVIAKIVDDPDELKPEGYKPNFGAFIVESNSLGVKVMQRCDFAGLRGIYNGITDFENCYVPREQLLGKRLLWKSQDAHVDDAFDYYQEGDGFRIALQALNSGRITLAAAAAGMAKNITLAGKWWGNTRKQWGKLIGGHEAVGSGLLTKALADSFAMEAMVWYAAHEADQHRDCRMEAATCKVYCSERAYKISDDFLQMRGGRGYETAASLAKRGDVPLAAEQWWRDLRINLIFEGESGTLLRMFVVREGVNDYMQRGMVFFDKGRYAKKLVTALGFAKDLAMLKMSDSATVHSPHMSELPPKLHPHMLYIEETTRRLARTIITLSGKYKNKLMHKQMTLRRFFEIAAELYTMATTCAYVVYSRLYELNNQYFIDLADLYCNEAAMKIEKDFFLLEHNNDAEARGVAKGLLAEHGYDQWLKEGIVSAVDQAVESPDVNSKKKEINPLLRQ